MWVAAERPPRTRAARLFVFSRTCVIISKPVTPCKTFRGNMAEFFNRLLARIFGYERLEINASDNKQTLQVVADGRPYRLRELGAGLAQFLVVFGNVAIRRPSLLLI